MLNRTIRQNIEIAVGINEIMELYPRITKESEIFPYAYNLVASDILNGESVDWDYISLLDFKDRKVTIPFSETRSISVDEEDYKTVLDHFSKRPGIKRVQFAYLTRLVLLYTRKKLREIKGVALEIKSKSEVEVETIKVDGVSLIRKIAELLEKDTESNQKKLLLISRIVEEEVQT